MSTTVPADWVELARRASEGREVVLLWNRSGNRVKVAVSDERLCHHLDLEIARTDALSAFSDSFARTAADLAEGAPAAAAAHPKAGGRRTVRRRRGLAGSSAVETRPPR